MENEVVFDGPICILDGIPLDIHRYGRSYGQLSDPLRKHLALKRSSRNMAATYFTETLSQQPFRRCKGKIPKTSHDLSTNHFYLFLSVTVAPVDLI